MLCFILGKKTDVAYSATATITMSWGSSLFFLQETSRQRVLLFYCCYAMGLAFRYEDVVDANPGQWLPEHLDGGKQG